VKRAIFNIIFITRAQNNVSGLFLDSDVLGTFSNIFVTARQLQSHGMPSQILQALEREVSNSMHYH